MEKRKAKLIVISGIIGVIIIVAFYLMLSRHKNLTTRLLQPPFVGIIQPELLDSIVKTLPLDQKLEMLVVCDLDSITDDRAFTKKKLESTNNSACLLASGTTTQFINQKNQLSKPFCFVRSSAGYPEFISNLLALPQLDVVHYIGSDSLKAQLIDYAANRCSELGIHANLMSLSCLFSKRNGYDSSYNEFVVRQTVPIIQALQKKNILCCLSGIKNFSLSDSLLLPDLVNLPKDSIPKIKMRRYLHLYHAFVDAGVSGFVFDNDSLVTLLRENLQFKGLLAFRKNKLLDSDDLKRFITSDFDLLLTGETPKGLVAEMSKLVSNNEVMLSAIDSKVRRIYESRYWATTDKPTNPQSDSTITRLDSIENLLFSKKIFENSVVLLNDFDSIIPFKHLENTKFAVLDIGSKATTHFDAQVKLYVKAEFSQMSAKVFINKKIQLSKDCNTIILTIGKIDTDEQFFVKFDAYLNELTAKKKKIVVVNFGEPERLLRLDTKYPIVQAHTSDTIAQIAVAQLLFGGIAANGILPYTIGSYKFGTGFSTRKCRLKYSIPEEAGLSSRKLKKIDSLVELAMKARAFPGCQIFVAKNGIVVYNRSFGYTDYKSNIKVEPSTVYDLASVTKIAGTTIAAMKMYDENKLKLDDFLGKFFDNTKIEYTRIKPDTIIRTDTFNIYEVRNIDKLINKRDTIHLSDSIVVAIDTLITRVTPKNNIFKVTIKDLLRHQSGILPSLPVMHLYLYKINPVRQGFRITDARLKYITDSLKRSYQPNRNQIISMKIRCDTLQSDQERIVRCDTLYYGFDGFYSRQRKDLCTLQIAENFYLKNRYFDSLWMDLKQLPVYHEKVYQYSDMNMILLQQAIDSLNDRSISDYLNEKIYKPLGLQTIGYQPTRHYDRKLIAPTEFDRVWRDQHLWGYVQDPSAAFLGGVSGNAGLFSNAHDLGILGQTLLNQGNYGGETYFDTATVSTFTTRQAGIQRALGFDMPGSETIITPSAPYNTYGHTGFTGTCMWIDPDNQLVYVFLSNRQCYGGLSGRFYTIKVREKIHKAIYEAINK